MDDVHLWMIDQHLGRRSISDFQRGVLALRKKDIVDEQRAPGVISINTAAAVATLPAEEQVIAANAGKDELKQAAKRVRDSKKKPREESGEADADESQQQAKPDATQLLEQRVAELTAENEDLKKQVAELRAQLGQ
jgi:hypothetical protein